MALPVAAPTIAYNATYDKLSVSWAANSDETLNITKYFIQLRSYTEEYGPPPLATSIEISTIGLTVPYSVELEIFPVDGNVYNCDIIAFAEPDVYSLASAVSNNVAIGIAPNSPTDLFATVNTSTGTVDFTWTPPEENGSKVIVEYQIYSEIPSPTGEYYMIKDMQSTSFSVAYNTPEFPWGRFYIVSETVYGVNDQVAVIRSANSALSNSISEPDPGPPLPTGPLPANPKLLAPVLGNLTITLSWTAVSAAAAPITGYRVRRSDNITYSLLIEGVDTKTLTITDGLLAGTPVTFTVSSVNANGDCLVPASITVTPISTPNPPAGFVAYVGKVPGTALLYWTPPSPANGGTPVTGYVLTYNEIIINLGTVNTFMVYIKDGVAVDFSLVSKNKIGVSSAVTANIDGIYVNPISITLSNPDPPLNIVAYVGLPGTVYLYWLPREPSNGGSPLTGYVLTYNGITMNLPGTALKFFDNVVPGQGITFSLVAKNKTGVSLPVTVDIFNGGDVTNP